MQKRKLEKCFLIGKIISEIDFKFIVNNKEIHAIAMFEIELMNATKLKVKAYNEIADYCYKNYYKNKYVCISRRINSEIEVTMMETMGPEG